MTSGSPQLWESTSSPASWVWPGPTGSRIPETRSLSEYLLVLSHGRWISLGFGLFGLGPTLCAHYPPQSTPTLQERRQIFKRLWVKHISCHSADTFSRPRNRNLRIP